MWLHQFISYVSTVHIFYVYVVCVYIYVCVCFGIWWLNVFTHWWCWRFLDPKALNSTEKWRSIHQSVAIFCLSFLLFPFWKRAWLTLDALRQKDAKGLFLTWGRKSSIKMGYKWLPIWVCHKNAGDAQNYSFNKDWFSKPWNGFWGSKFLIQSHLVNEKLLIGNQVIIVNVGWFQFQYMCFSVQQRWIVLCRMILIGQ